MNSFQTTLSPKRDKSYEYSIVLPRCVAPEEAAGHGRVGAVCVHVHLSGSILSLCLAVRPSPQEGIRRVGSEQNCNFEVALIC